LSALLFDDAEFDTFELSFPVSGVRYPSVHCL
jgi:hypothetical protein